MNAWELHAQSVQITFQGCFLPSFDSFRKADSEKNIVYISTNQKQELPVAAMFDNGSELNQQSSQRTFHGYFLPRFDSFGQSVTEENILQKSTNQKQELPVEAMFVNGSERNEQSSQRTCNTCRCFLPSFGSFDTPVAEEKILKKSANQNQELPMVAMFANGSELIEQTIQRTFQGDFLPSSDSFGQAVSEEKIFFQKLSNQKQELPVAAIFVNGSELNEHSLQRTFQGCFLPSFYSFCKAVLEETIFQKSANQKQ